MTLLSEWIYRVADQQPALDRTLYYDRAETAKVMEDRLALLEEAINLLGAFGYYWWQPYNDEMLSPPQANALNRAIAEVSGKRPPAGWLEFLLPDEV